MTASYEAIRKKDYPLDEALLRTDLLLFRTMEKHAFGPNPFQIRAVYKLEALRDIASRAAFAYGDSYDRTEDEAACMKAMACAYALTSNARIYGFPELVL